MYLIITDPLSGFLHVRRNVQILLNVSQKKAGNVQFFTNNVTLIRKLKKEKLCKVQSGMSRLAFCIVMPCGLVERPTSTSSPLSKPLISYRLRYPRGSNALQSTLVWVLQGIANIRVNMNNNKYPVNMEICFFPCLLYYYFMISYDMQKLMEQMRSAAL
jgi:hypothetical protein